MLKVHWLWPTFWIMPSAALLPQVWAEACIYIIISQLRTKHSSLNWNMFGKLNVQLRNELYFVKLSKICSVSKWIIVRQTVWSMFSEQTVHLIKNRLKGWIWGPSAWIHTGWCLPGALKPKFEPNHQLNSFWSRPNQLSLVSNELNCH